MQAQAAGVAIAPDCGLSPGMASILGGELLRRIGGKADALKIYVGGLPQSPKPPFNYQLVFSVEGLINEYCEPAKILRNGKMITIEPLTEVEAFRMEGFPELEAFHTSGGTSTLPETFQGQVGECFEKTLRYPGHVSMLRSLYDLGLFSSEKRRIDGAMISPRQMMSSLFVEKFSGNEPELTILRVEAHHGDVDRVLQHGRLHRQGHGSDLDDAYHRVAGLDRAADDDRRARSRSAAVFARRSMSRHSCSSNEMAQRGITINYRSRVDAGIRDRRP